MYYPSSKNKGTDQLHGYLEADLRLCVCICKMLKCLFSHDTAYIIFLHNLILYSLKIEAFSMVQMVHF